MVLLIVALIGFTGTQSSMLRIAVLSGTLPDETAQEVPDDLNETEPVVLPCGSAHAEHGHSEGTLAPQYNDSGTLTGWSCVFNSHHACEADAKGQTWECTFSPDEMSFPDPVSEDVLNNPPPAPTPLPTGGPATGAPTTY